MLIFSQVTNQNKAGSTQRISLLSDWVLDLLFNPEDGGNIRLQNVGILYHIARCHIQEECSARIKTILSESTVGTG
jgi:hypothetical protein